MLKQPETERLIAELFDNQPDAVVWFSPIFNDPSFRHSISDFEVHYANNAAGRFLGAVKTEIVGTSLRKSPWMDETTIDIIFTQCLEVWNSGEPVEYTYYNAGFDRYFNVQRSKVEDGILSITRDRTKEVRTEIERQEQEKMYQQILDTSADGIMLLKAVRNSDHEIIDFRLAHCNRKGYENAQLPPDATSRTLLELLPHLKGTDQFALHKQVVKTGESRRFETSFRTPNGAEYGWFIVTLSKLGDGVISNFVDISEKKNREQQLVEKTNLMNNILDASLGAVYTCEAVRDEQGAITDFRFVQVNQKFRQFSVRPDLDVIGKNLLEEFPHTRQTNTAEKLIQVIETGIADRFEVHYHSDTYEGWYDTSAVKMGENGVVVTFVNVTEQKKTANEIEHQKDLLDKMLRFSPSSITLMEAIRNTENKVVDFRYLLVNDRAAQFAGMSKEDLLTKTNADIDPKFCDSPVHKELVATLETGEPSYSSYLLPNGVWIEGAVSKMDDDHMICITTDVTTAKEAQRKVEQAAAELRAVFNATQTGMFTFLPVWDENGEIVDFRFVIVNPTISAFVGQLPEAMEGGLGSTWFLGYLSNGVFDMYKHTFLTGEPQRREVHYHVDGHDNYLDLQCVKVGDRVLVSFTDHTDLRTAQKQLEKSVEELRRSNESLEEFTSAASHDLKEPIRKVHFFIERLKTKLQDRLSLEEVNLMERVETATERMKLLVDDLLDYSHVSRGHLEMEDIDLKKKVGLILTDLELLITEKNAHVHVGQLPVVKGHRRQVQQLFQNLIGNALKYSKQGTLPVVQITSGIITGRDAGMPVAPDDEEKSFHRIVIADNGIGFEQQYADKIFNIFTRLHGNLEYKGTGVGLAIVKKVVENHKGYIAAQSEPGQGATFIVLLPA